MKLIHPLSSVMLCSLLMTTCFAAPMTIGWIEDVTIHPQKLVMTAKIDTGADYSSVHAENIRISKKNGIEIAAFTLRNKQGESRQIERPVIRYALIKRKGAAPLQRPVVEIELCLGNSVRTAQINLSNRENFNYKMLIGRSYLKQGYLVDSNRTYTVPPTCGYPSKESGN